MVKEWPDLRVLVCSVEKVWVVSSKGWPSSLVKRGKNSSTTCAEGCQGYMKRAGGTVTRWLSNGTHAKTEETKRYKEKNYNKGDHFDEKAQTRHIRHILVCFFSSKIK